VSFAGGPPLEELVAPPVPPVPLVELVLLLEEVVVLPEVPLELELILPPVPPVPVFDDEQAGARAPSVREMATATIPSRRWLISSTLLVESSFIARPRRRETPSRRVLSGREHTGTAPSLAWHASCPSIFERQPKPHLEPVVGDSLQLR